MIKLEIYIGLNDKDKGYQKIKTIDALKFVVDEFAEFNLSYDIIFGLWKSQNEQTIHLTIIESEDTLISKEQDIKTTLENIKEKLNQETIMITSQKLTEVEYV